MGRFGILLALTACNQVFGLHNTELPPIDALPKGCPAIGTAPQFSTEFEQVIDQTCESYNIAADTGLAMATCYDATKTRAVGIAPVDQPLGLVDVPPLVAAVNIESPTFVPEGDRAYIDRNNYDLNGTDLVSEYRPIDATHWMYVRDLPLAQWLSPSGNESYFGAPSRGPHRHMMISACLGAGCADFAVTEVVEQDDGSWVQQGLPYLASELGIADLYASVQLSPDGLRAILPATAAGEKGVFYADRPTIDSRFSAASVLRGVPNIRDPFMTEDCTRVYFSGLGSIFYVRQI